jgi:hypothetical protein
MQVAKDRMNRNRGDPAVEEDFRGVDCLVSLKAR